MNPVVINHGFLLNLRYAPVDLRPLLECVTAAQAAERPLRVHPDAVLADVGGMPLAKWVASGVSDSEQRDRCLAVQRVLDAGPFLDLELNVAAVDVAPDPTGAPLAGLLCAAFGDALINGSVPSLLSVCDRKSGLTAPNYAYATLTVLNYIQQVTFEKALRDAADVAVNDLRAALLTVTQRHTNVGIGKDLRVGIERGAVQLRAERLLRAAEAAEAAGKTRRENGDWRKRWQEVFSGALKDESDTVRNTPSLRALRNFRLQDGTRQYVFDHADVAKGDRLYIHVPPMGNPEIVAWEPHIKTKNY